LTFDPAKASELDYVIGSLHGVMRDGAFRPLDGMFRWFQTGGKQPYAPDVDLTDLEAWIDEWLGILRHCFQTTPIDILGHPTLTPVLPLDPDPEKAYQPEWEERLCALALEYGVALEISGRYKLPHERLLRLGKDMGVVFAIGSDGHQPGQICDLAYPLQMIEKIGLPSSQIFDVEAKPRARLAVRSGP
jgi:histidinol phosphatase-like PHP family hydrolase